MAQADTNSGTPHPLHQLSLHRFVSLQAQRHGSTLRPLGQVNRALAPMHPGTFDASVRAMHHWCRLNEELVLERHSADAEVFVGFERLTRVRPAVASRYRRLASKVGQLALFAEHDTTLDLNCAMVDVAGSPLSREWFLAINAPNYKALLVARDQQGFGPTGPLLGRRFIGLSTHDSKLVLAAIEVLRPFAIHAPK